MDDIGEETLEERGITYSNTQVRDGDIAYEFMVVEARDDNDNTTLKCVSFPSELVPYRSEAIWLHIQGSRAYMMVYVYN